MYNIIMLSAGPFNSSNFDEEATSESSFQFHNMLQDAYVPKQWNAMKTLLHAVNTVEEGHQRPWEIANSDEQERDEGE